MRQAFRLGCLLVVMLLAVLMAGCDQEKSPTVNLPPVSLEQGKNPAGMHTNGQSQPHKITVYFATKDASKLVPEVTNVGKTEYTAHKAMEILISGPKNSELVRVLPANTKLKGITIKGHTAYVDFNDKILKMTGSATETLAVAAIVNTLTEFEEIEKVQILVNGKQVDTLAGHMDVSQPLSRAESLIK